ncbi:hypothetical protein [Paenibacillus sp.]|uniref:hypothetical protein n=1 Tax=Paenibacillus sp. TaxID=58172 RepID=UPI002D3B948F|nr:hypothetical protein [Paenibacillus sp.]HZG55063.1 hypothetical protein [Paenibacillus sp.]
MFDPTIFDNWKVVLEGALYDLDRDGAAEIIGREDLMDLASLSRSFRIGARRPGGGCRAELRLSSGLADFAAERYDLRLTELGAPGIRLELRFTLPGARVRDAQTLHGALSRLWAAEAEAEICHRVRIEVDPHAPPADAAAAGGSAYEIDVLFHEKRNEDRLDDVDALLERLLASLDALDGLETKEA